MHRGLTCLMAFVCSASSSALAQDCGSPGPDCYDYDWEQWDMYRYEDVPIKLHHGKHVPPGTPGRYDPEVKSPLIIYLHSNGPYGGTGLSEEEYWLRLWEGSHDESGHYPGLKHWTVMGERVGHEGEMAPTGWIYAIPNGAVDDFGLSGPPCQEEFSLARYWNATDNCCAYNWFEPDSFTGMRPGAVDHVTYLNNLIAWVKKNYTVDENRVYLYGYSNGGYMCHRMACENGRFGYFGYRDCELDCEQVEPQAIASVGVYAGVTWMNPANCHANWPTNVLQTHDIGDTECLYDGGVDFEYGGVCYPGYSRPYPGAIYTVNSWISLNQTNGTPDPQPAIVPFDLSVWNSYAQVLTWSHGLGGSVVEHWQSVFGSHGATFSNVYRTRLIEWFLDHPRPNYDISPVEVSCPTDLDDDGLTDGTDLGLLFTGWGSTGPGDLDGSGAVDGADFGLMLLAWGPCGG